MATRRQRGRRAGEIADLPARLALGGAMLYHGLEKVRHPEASVGFFEQLGFRPGKRWVLAAGLAETFAGAAAILGIATRPAALLVIATQGVAMWKVHRPNGYANTKGGLEYNVALVSIAAGLALEGPRRISADHAMRRALRRPRTAGWLARVPWLARRPGALERALDVIH